MKRVMNEITYSNVIPQCCLRTMMQYIAIEHVIVFSFDDGAVTFYVSISSCIITILCYHTLMVYDNNMIIVPITIITVNE
jgi:hypothetical protein